MEKAFNIKVCEAYGKYNAVSNIMPTLLGYLKKHLGQAVSASDQFDVVALFARIGNILIEPKKEWPRVAAEARPISQLQTYVALLLVFPAVSSFIKHENISAQIKHVNYSPQHEFLLQEAVVSVVSTFIGGLIVAYISCRIANYFAPKFNGQANRNNAYALAAYSMTPSQLGSILMLAPYTHFVSILALIALLYGIYIYRLGAPQLLKIPEGSAAGFTAAVFCTSILAGVMVFGVLIFLLISPLALGPH